MTLATAFSAMAQERPHWERGMHARHPDRAAMQAERANARAAMREQRMQQMDAQRSRRDEASRPAPPVMVPAPVPQAPVEAPRDGRPGRLSPEERRALRQQINDAGRDVYRGNGR